LYDSIFPFDTEASHRNKDKREWNTKSKEDKNLLLLSHTTMGD